MEYKTNLPCRFKLQERLHISQNFPPLPPWVPPPEEM